MAAGEPGIGCGTGPRGRAMRAALDWRRALVFTHRWLGIAGGLLFVLWFASGIVMIYKRMPVLEPEERLMRLPTLDLSAVPVAISLVPGQGRQIERMDHVDHQGQADDQKRDNDSEPQHESPTGAGEARPRLGEQILGRPCVASCRVSAHVQVH